MITKITGVSNHSTTLYQLTTQPNNQSISFKAQEDEFVSNQVSQFSKIAKSEDIVKLANISNPRERKATVLKFMEISGEYPEAMSKLIETYDQQKKTVQLGTKYYKHPFKLNDIETIQKIGEEYVAVVKKPENVEHTFLSIIPLDSPSVELFDYILKNDEMNVPMLPAKNFGEVSDQISVVIECDKTNVPKDFREYDKEPDMISLRELSRNGFKMYDGPNTIWDTYMSFLNTAISKASENSLNKDRN